MVSTTKGQIISQRYLGDVRLRELNFGEPTPELPGPPVDFGTTGSGVSAAASGGNPAPVLA